MKSSSSAIDWLSALVHPKNRVEIDFHGVPAYYVAKSDWSTQPRPFGQHLLYYVANGSFYTELEKTDATLHSGDFFWLPPWTSFRCWLPDDKPAGFYRFRLTVENPAGKSLYHSRAPLIVRDLNSAQAWFEEIVRTRHHDKSPLSAWRLRGSLLGLFADVLSPGSTTAPGGQFNARQKEMIAEWMHRHAARPITPAQMAAQLQLSPDYFARIFRQSYGLSPRAWIVRERIKMAAIRLLESQLHIGQVAEEFGYRDIFFFSRQFKQVMGRSPRQYREEA